MKIELTQGYTAIINRADLSKVNYYKWHALVMKHGVVACTMIGKKPNRTRLYIHRLIMDVKDRNVFVDHKDHNPLNNRRSNLRLATPAQNRHNSRAYKRSKTSKYLGVSFDSRDKVYVAQIAIDGKQVKVGRSINEHTAARIYNKFAKRYYKEFAVINKIK